jgi:hypothetical protein
MASHDDSVAQQIELPQKHHSPPKKKQHAHTQDLCCCPPRALLWGGTCSTSVTVGNLIDMKRRLQARADSNASIKPPSGPDSNADGSGGSQIDEGTLKPVDFILKTDTYKINWKAESNCKPVSVSLSVGGSVVFSQSCLPEDGGVELSSAKVFSIEEFKNRRHGTVVATLSVTDCTGMSGDCSITLYEP